MPKVATTLKDDKGEYNYFVAQLGAVLTPREVQVMFGVSYTSIIYQMDKGVIQFRRSITGGSILLHRPSVEVAYGDAVYDPVSALYIPEHIQLERKR